MPLLASGASPELPGVSAAMRKAVEKGDISGAVTVVLTKDKVLHCDATGLADISRKEPMTPDSLFWIASMTKPVTAVAVLMLQDEGKLKVADPVAKYIAFEPACQSHHRADADSHIGLGRSPKGSGCQSADSS